MLSNIKYLAVEFYHRHGRRNAYEEQGFPSSSDMIRKKYTSHKHPNKKHRDPYAFSGFSFRGGCHGGFGLVLRLFQHFPRIVLAAVAVFIAAFIVHKIADIHFPAIRNGTRRFPAFRVIHNTYRTCAAYNYHQSIGTKMTTVNKQLLSIKFGNCGNKQRHTSPNRIDLGRYVRRRYFFDATAKSL